MSTKKPLVSVLVHTKNSIRTIKRHLESIKNQSYKHIEIIAVDNHSTDGTYHMLTKYTKHVYTYGPERSAQRNYAVRHATGAYLYIPDSDMILSKHVVRDLVQAVVGNPDIKALIIPEKTKATGYWGGVKIYERDFYWGEESIEAERFFETKAFKKLGGYDESITGPEDWDLPRRFREKYQTGRIASPIVHDEGHITLLGLFRKKYYYARKASVYLKKHAMKKSDQQFIYFLRPVYYRKWQRLVRQPIMAASMMLMLLVEQIGGVLGYLKGEES